MMLYGADKRFTCPSCGNQPSRETASTRAWKCDCGSVLDIFSDKEFDNIRINKPGETRVVVNRVLPSEIVRGNHVYMHPNSPDLYLVYDIVETSKGFNIRLKGYGTWPTKKREFVDRYKGAW